MTAELPHQSATPDDDGAAGAVGAAGGLVLSPLRGLRPAVGDERTGALLCPPYDVIGPQDRKRLLGTDPDNIVAVVLPDPTPDGYQEAADRLDQLVADGVYALDDVPAVYVYEMADPSGHVTRGLLGAVTLRDPAEGVILPHENTMAGPVADRLAVMTATGCDLEPIYLVYDGGGAASDIVRRAGTRDPLVTATTPDGIVHRLWALTAREDLDAITADLADRHALIADGHHRYATYRERQRLQQADAGPGPWDRGLALLVDSTDYGPQVHAIHRVLPGLPPAEAVRRLRGWATVAPLDPQSAGDALAAATSFAVVLTDGTDGFLVTDDSGRLSAAAADATGDPSLGALDVSVVHAGLVTAAWGLPDDEDTVGYAHDIDEAVEGAVAAGGTAMLLRPTPVADVAGVAAAGARMPRKSTLFTPKPASGLVLRRLSDE